MKDQALDCTMDRTWMRVARTMKTSVARFARFASRPGFLAAACGSPEIRPAIRDPPQRPHGPMTSPTNISLQYEKFRLKELLISGKVRDDSVICLFKEPHFATLNENVRKGPTAQEFWIVALLCGFNSWPFARF